MNKDVQILPFRREHLDRMVLQEHEKKVLDFDKFFIVSAGPDAVTYTYVYKHRILGVGGYYQMWPGVIEVFVVPTLDFFKYPKQVYRLCKLYFDYIVNKTKARRIQTASLDCDIRNRFMLKFGFACEGTMKNYTSDGQDYKMWAIVKRS